MHCRIKMLVALLPFSQLSALKLCVSDEFDQVVDTKAVQAICSIKSNVRNSLGDVIFSFVEALSLSKLADQVCLQLFYNFRSQEVL